jgi:antitoxin (DNA-binding transcriptional repressor) of toxin-antitoxin stability system
MVLTGEVFAMEAAPMHKAKSNLSQLVKLAAEGETIFIGSYGRAQAALVPSGAVKPKRKIGTMAGRFALPDDFDDPLPDYILAAFGETE